MSPLPPPRSKLPPAKKLARKVLQQESLFDLPPDWTQEWKGMPEYVVEDLSPFRSVIIHFACDADADRFAEVTGLRITGETRSTWFPKADMDRVSKLRYIDAKDARMTHRYFEWRKGEQLSLKDIPGKLPPDIEESVMNYKTFVELLDAYEKSRKVGGRS